MIRALTGFRMFAFELLLPSSMRNGLTYESRLHILNHVLHIVWTKLSGWFWSVGCVMNRAVSRYIWPILLTAAALGLRMLLNPWLGVRIPYVTFYLSVALSATLRGLVPGLLAVVLGALAAMYFFVPPIYSLAVAGTEHALILAVDVAVAVALVVLADMQRRAAAE